MCICKMLLCPSRAVPVSGVPAVPSPPCERQKGVGSLSTYGMPEETILGPLSVLGGPKTMRVVLNSSSSSLVRVVLNSSSSKPSSLLCRGSRGRAHRRARRCGTRRSWPTSRLSAPRCTRGLDKRRMPARKRERMRKAARADVHDGLQCLPGGWAPHGDTRG